MDVGSYADRIEAAVDEPTELADLRREIEQDETLDPRDRESLDERVGGYLADFDEEHDAGDAEAELA